MNWQSFCMQHAALASGSPLVKYRAYVRIGNYNFEALAVAAITHRCRYVENTFKSTTVTLLITANDRRRALAYQKEQIRITLIQSLEDGASALGKDYVAILTDFHDDQLAGNVSAVNDTDYDQSAGVSMLTLELFDRATMHLRSTLVGHIFHDTDPLSALKYVLTQHQLADVESLDSAVKGIVADPTFKTMPPRLIEIPQGTAIDELPAVLQRYNLSEFGLSIYFYKGYWYLFQPWNTNRFTSGGAKLVVINLPADRSAGLTEGFYVNGKTLTVLASGFTQIKDQAQLDYHNEGVAVQFSDPTKLLENAIDTDPSKTPQTVPEEVIDQYSIHNHASGFNRSRIVPGRFNDSPALIASEMARRGGEIVTVNWENGDIDLLSPDQAVKFIYAKNDKPMTKSGTIVAATSHSSLLEGGFANPLHKKTVSITLFLKDDVIV